MTQARGYTDRERLIIFQRAFHDLAHTTYWPKLREATRADKHVGFSVRVAYDSGHVQISQPSLDDEAIHLASASVRKFLSGGDPVCLEEVLLSARAAGARGRLMDEADLLWAKLTDKWITVLVQGGETVGVDWLPQHPPVVWRREDRAGLGPVTCEAISIRLCAEVTWNESLFHAFERGRNERQRALARSLPTPLLEQLTGFAISWGVYAMIIAHHQIHSLGGEFSCPSGCPELALLHPDALDRFYRDREAIAGT